MALRLMAKVGLSPSADSPISVGPCPAYWYTDMGDWLGDCGELRVHPGSFLTPDGWAQWWDTALSHAPHFTWLFVQDHRGGQESPQHIAAYFKALNAKMSARGVKFWGNAEFFHIMRDTAANGGEGNATRTQGSIDRVHRQLLEEAPHVGGFTMWEWHWYLSPAGGVQQHRASASSALHSNGSLSLYRNYQRTVMAPGVPLLLASAGHPYAIQPPPEHRSDFSGTRLTDGRAYSSADDCVGWAAGTQTIAVTLNLTTTAEHVPASSTHHYAASVHPFRVVSSLRAYFLYLKSVSMPSSVSASCSLDGLSDWSTPAALTPATAHPSEGQMIVWDTVLPDPVVASVCVLKIERAGSSVVLLAEVEAYE